MPVPKLKSFFGICKKNTKENISLTNARLLLQNVLISPYYPGNYLSTEKIPVKVTGEFWQA